MTTNEIDLIADKVFDKIKRYIQPEELISKYSACRLLGVGRTTFSKLISLKKIPKGIKKVGFKELFWNKAELLTYKRNNNGKTQKQTH